MTDAKTPKRPAAGKDPISRKEGYLGWVIMRTPTRRSMRIFHSGFAERNLAGKPKVVWWPVLDDWEGAKHVVDLIMDDDRDGLFELTLRYPEHTFGFEPLLKGHDRGGEIAERVTLKSIILKRGHHMDIDLVEKLNGTVELHARIMRGGKAIVTEVVETLDAGTDAANLSMSLPE